MKQTKYDQTMHEMQNLKKRMDEILEEMERLLEDMDKLGI